LPPSSSSHSLCRLPDRTEAAAKGQAISTGHDERTWIDHFGYPHSDEMVLEERYTRINYDTIELKIALARREL
jgi:hypothetical protein